MIQSGGEYTETNRKFASEIKSTRKNFRIHKADFANYQTLIHRFSTSGLFRKPITMQSVKRIFLFPLFCNVYFWPRRDFRFDEFHFRRKCTT